MISIRYIATHTPYQWEYASVTVEHWLGAFVTGRLGPMKVEAIGAKDSFLLYVPKAKRWIAV